MIAKLDGSPFTDLRRFARVPYRRAANYVYAADQGGSARVCEVGRGGLRIEMGRYLRPGTRLLLRIAPQHHPLTPPAQTPELKTVIVWCKQARESQSFLAGLRVIYDEPEALTVVSDLVHLAIANHVALAWPQPLTQRTSAEPSAQRAWNAAPRPDSALSQQSRMLAGSA